MTETRYTDTIDWNRFWIDTDDTDRSDTSPSADLAVEPVLAFLEEQDPPASYADVGCGPGAIVAAVADRYPDASVVGYDAAEAILEDNRDRFDDVGNVRFDHTVLPTFEPGREFDVVSCLFTLCYVVDSEEAIANLYEAVRPGGYLLVHYHNRLAHAHYRRIATDPHEHIPTESPWDPETFVDRFALTIDGRNLLSYDRIHDVLGTWPQSVFSVTSEVEPYGAHRYEPLVYIPK